MYGIQPPTIEPDIEGAVFIDSPENLNAAGKIRDLPWIAGVNRDEGLVFSSQFYENPNAFEGVLNDIDLVLPAVFGYGNIVDDVTAYTAALKSFYLNDLTADRSLLLSNYTKLNSDAPVIYPAYKAFQQHLVHAKSPHYFYSFEYRGEFSHNYIFSGGSTRNTGVAHGDELVYLFKNHDSLYGLPDYQYSESDLVMVETMVQMWTSFAINGTPTTVNSDNTTIWQPYSSLNNYLRIGNESDPSLEMKYDLFLERMQFWDELTRSTTA